MYGKQTYARSIFRGPGAGAGILDADDHHRSRADHDDLQRVDAAGIDRRHRVGVQHVRDDGRHRHRHLLARGGRPHPARRAGGAGARLTPCISRRCRAVRGGHGDHGAEPGRDHDDDRTGRRRRRRRGPRTDAGRTDLRQLPGLAAGEGARLPRRRAGDGHRARLPDRRHARDVCGLARHVRTARGAGCGRLQTERQVEPRRRPHGCADRQGRRRPGGARNSVHQRRGQQPHVVGRAPRDRRCAVSVCSTCRPRRS